MEISLRLKTIADLVKYQTVADIGTDHGYVPIYLVSQNRASRVIACDVNKGPMEKANENIKEHGLSNEIQTRLGNGLEPIKKGEVSAVVIAGMGGMLIIDILKKNLELTKSFKQLVLSPHLDIYETRKYLHSINFKIEEEEMIEEEGKFYTIISAVPGQEHYEKEQTYLEEAYLEEEYLFGKYNLDNKNIVLKQYLEKKIEKLESIFASLIIAQTDNSLLKVEEIKKEILLHRKVLKRYEM